MGAKNWWKAIGVAIVMLMGLAPVVAQQPELAALLEVMEGVVEVNRVNTEQWIAVRVEAIVGVGDRIRTDTTGEARVTFFADGIETDIRPNTEMRIEQFRGNEQTFELQVEVILGQTLQRIERALDASSSYSVTTPAMSLAARGTQFAIRVEESGRSAMLVSEGNVEAANPEEVEAVAPGFGIRAESAGELSDVVRAATFEALDASLDGCSAVLTTIDDVSLNVRQAPSIDAALVGYIAAADIDILIGVTEAGKWYRIEFQGGFGWVQSTTAVIDENCAGLRLFPDDVAPEDASLFETSNGTSPQESATSGG
ncbi:MAG: FecR domain-containing protein [Anaerolineae bacterium]|nr:FecR domain-containing protein [Anaerolineae bacterium]NUQ02459.1 FecR domain-containing protein [Anaerolineae bacterium]